MKLVRAVTEEELPMDQDLYEKLKSGEIKARKNTGIMTLPNVNLPLQLEKAATILFKKFGNKQMIAQAEQLSFRLMSRQLPLEKNEMNLRRKKIRQKIEQNNAELAKLEGEDRNQYSKIIDEKVDKEVQRHNHWREQHYNASTGMMYMVARLAQNYAVLLQILNEIWKRDPNYVPKTLFDFGSGIGTSIWATQNNPAWKKEISEYYCVDPSVDMNTIARLLLQDGHEEKEMSVKGVNFRKFQPSSANSFNMVLSAYTLIENSNQTKRLELVQRLWEMTEDYLILVEMGSFAGHKLIQEARDYILEISKEDDSEKKAHVFAPCPHDLPCPKMRLPDRVPCAFVVNYKPLEIITKKIDKKSEKYTYVIIKKSKEPVQAKLWPRLVSESTYASKHIHCRMCCPNGELDHIIITKKKHSSEMYHVAKSIGLGDFLPATYTDQSVKSSDRESYKVRMLNKKMNSLNLLTGQENRTGNETELDEMDDIEEDEMDNIEQDEQDEVEHEELEDCDKNLSPVAFMEKLESNETNYTKNISRRNSFKGRISDDFDIGSTS